jgi:ribulose bisphosphate carboxylase small subunit
VLREPEPSEPELFHEKSLHKYVRIQGISNSELIGSNTGAELSELELFREQNLQRYVRIQGFSNSELIGSVTGAGAFS